MAGLHSQAAIMSRGDPGLFSSLGRAFRGAVGGFLAGGPAGAAAGAVTTVLRPGGAPTLPAPGAIDVAREVGTQIALPGIAAGIQRVLPGGRTGTVTVDCPRGFHLNKTSYMTKAGFVPARSKCVRNRRRNISNGRANMRALRRIAAWDKADRSRRKTLKRIAK